MLWCQGAQSIGPSNQPSTYSHANVHRVITMHARPRQTDGRTNTWTNIMAIARRFVPTNASRANERV